MRGGSAAEATGPCEAKQTSEAKSNPYGWTVLPTTSRQAKRNRQHQDAHALSRSVSIDSRIDNIKCNIIERTWHVILLRGHSYTPGIGETGQDVVSGVLMLIASHLADECQRAALKTSSTRSGEEKSIQPRHYSLGLPLPSSSLPRTVLCVCVCVCAYVWVCVCVCVRRWGARQVLTVTKAMM